MSSPPVLSRRELNRATLARQLLLERATIGVPAAVQALGGLQAQEPKHPFIGLWTRLDGFSSAGLLEAIASREVVRATLLRSTLHLFTAADPMLVGLSALQDSLWNRLRSPHPDLEVAHT